MVLELVDEQHEDRGHAHGVQDAREPRGAGVGVVVVRVTPGHRITQSGQSNAQE